MTRSTDTVHIDPGPNTEAAQVSANPEAAGAASSVAIRPGPARDTGVLAGKLLSARLKSVIDALEQPKAKRAQACEQQASAVERLRTLHPALDRCVTCIKLMLEAPSVKPSGPTISSWQHDMQAGLQGIEEQLEDEGGMAQELVQGLRATLSLARERTATEPVLKAVEVARNITENKPDVKHSARAVSDVGQIGSTGNEHADQAIQLVLGLLQRLQAAQASESGEAPADFDLIGQLEQLKEGVEAEGAKAGGVATPLQKALARCHGRCLKLATQALTRFVHNAYRAYAAQCDQLGWRGAPSMEELKTALAGPLPATMARLQANVDSLGAILAKVMQSERDLHTKQALAEGSNILQEHTQALRDLVAAHGRAVSLVAEALGAVPGPAHLAALCSWVSDHASVLTQLATKEIQQHHASLSATAPDLRLAFLGQSEERLGVVDLCLRDAIADGRQVAAVEVEGAADFPMKPQLLESLHGMVAGLQALRTSLADAVALYREAGRSASTFSNPSPKVRNAMLEKLAKEGLSARPLHSLLAEDALDKMDQRWLDQRQAADRQAAAVEASPLAQEKALFRDDAVWSVDTRLQAAVLRASAIRRRTDELADEPEATRVSDATLRAMKAAAAQVLSDYKTELRGRLERLPSLQGEAEVKRHFTDKANAALAKVSEEEEGLEKAFSAMGIAG